MTQFKNLLSLFSIVLCILLCKPFDSKAQGFSYVYIQGDKKTPIYTKVEGVMMPRYGKNYALLARLAPGPMNVEILFQQNEYPPIQFNILVPENGKRAFVLQKKEEVFSLYDVEQGFYLKANNDIADDHIPSVLSNADIVPKAVVDSKPDIVIDTAKVVINADTALVEPTPIVSIADSVKTPIATDTVAITTTKEIFLVDSIADIGMIDSAKTPIGGDQILTTATTEAANADTSKPNFISNIVFDNSANKSEEQTELNITELPSTGTVEAAKIVNSDCSSQISSLQFARLSNLINAKKTENERLGLILEATKKDCFSTAQCQQMIESLASDIAKFTAIKGLYPKTTDQSNFGQLAAQLTSEEWKEYFQNLIKRD